MKKVFLSYNPYKLETTITVDGRPLADNSRLGEMIVDSRLQEWVEDFPYILMEEYNDLEFEITFHGTLPDYEDLDSTFKTARKQSGLSLTARHSPAKETADKESLIEEVFQKLMDENCPFPELRTQDLKAAFEQAKSSDFEVCVVATMSAGKSTLINAMLRKKLMPSKQEACTAAITRIKDTDCEDFRAEIYDEKGVQIGTRERLDYAVMDQLNGDKDVSTIKVSGKIPFVAADGTTQKNKISLVLIDTPGPNNARNPEHRKVQSELLGKSSKALVLYIMTGEFGTDDDNSLLARVAESMSVRGKQSKDRFIFVVNKLDDRKKEDGDTGQTLERVRAYLETHGIKNPNLFPAAALPALNIRLQDSSSLDKDEQEETETKIKKLNRNENLHFETWAVLPSSVRGEISRELEKTRKNWTGRDNENPKEALIHSGVVSVEAAIRQYVRKYAETAKIKNIVDTFIHRVKELECEEQAILAISESEEESRRIAFQIQQIQQKMDRVDDAIRFQSRVDAAVATIHEDSQNVIETIMVKFQEQITKRIENARGRELTLDEAERELEQLIRFAEKLEPDFETDLKALVTSNLVKTRNALIEEYKKKIAALKDELGADGMTTGFHINPLELMCGSIPYGFSMRNLVQEREVENGRERVTTRKWYKPWTWFDAGYIHIIYKTEKYVSADELAQKFFVPIQKAIAENQKRATDYALKHSKEIAKQFNEEFGRLDSILQKRLSELESLTSDHDKAKERAEQARRRKAWLDDIQNRVESILEI